MDSVAINRDNPLVECRHVILCLAIHGLSFAVIQDCITYRVLLRPEVLLAEETRIVEPHTFDGVHDIFHGVKVFNFINWVVSDLHVEVDVAIVLCLHPLSDGLKVIDSAESNVCKVRAINIKALLDMICVNLCFDDLLRHLVLVVIVKFKLVANRDLNWSNFRQVLQGGILHSITRKVDISRALGLLVVIPVLGARVAFAVRIFVESHSRLFYGIDFCEVKTACFDIISCQVPVIV